jgi:hypothetical protein
VRVKQWVAVVIAVSVDADDQHRSSVRHQGRLALKSLEKRS